MSSVLVTGGAGFIGSHLVEALLAHGHEVRVLDDLSSGRAEQVAHGARLTVGDVRDAAAVAAAVQGCEVAYHLAARSSVPRSLADPETAMSVNAHGTLVLLAAARDAGVRRVVVTSSSSVYGSAAEVPVAETAPLRPLSPYAASKAAAELLAGAWHASLGLETLVLRLFNVYGPRQPPGGTYAAVVPRWLEAAFAGRPATLFGDGSQSRDFTFVGDAVEAFVAAGTVAGAGGQAYNVSGGRSVSLLELAGLVEQVTASRLRLLREPRRGAEVMHSGADLSRARAVLGWEPGVALGDGLRRLAEQGAPGLDTAA